MDPSFNKCWMNEVRVWNDHSSNLSDSALLETWPKQCWTLLEIFCLQGKDEGGRLVRHSGWFFRWDFFKRKKNGEREREVWSDWSTSVEKHLFTPWLKLRLNRSGLLPSGAFDPPGGSQLHFSGELPSAAFLQPRCNEFFKPWRFTALKGYPGPWN